MLLPCLSHRRGSPFESLVDRRWFLFVLTFVSSFSSGGVLGAASRVLLRYHLCDVCLSACFPFSFSSGEGLAFASLGTKDVFTRELDV